MSKKFPKASSSIHSISEVFVTLNIMNILHQTIAILTHYLFESAKPFVVFFENDECRSVCFVCKLNIK